MGNGYFQLVNMAGGYGIHLIPSAQGQEKLSLAEVMHYLEAENIPFEIPVLKQAVESGKEQLIHLSVGECPAVNEKYVLTISDDKMLATARFYAPSETGKRLSFNEFINDLRYRNVLFGVQMQDLQDHFMTPDDYCTDVVVAKGKEPKLCTDDKIEYFFNTDVHAQPQEREDGSVDYYHLNIINHCKAGDVLARIIRGTDGQAGSNIIGQKIAAREPKRVILRHGRNIVLSEDGLSISSAVNGHVTLVDGNVFVSDVYEIENVDTSTGDIEYTGSIVVNGNVTAGFSVQAGGNVLVKGVVEGARIVAGGNIEISRGMNGMNRGFLQAGGHVISKFIENATVRAGGYVNTESLLHCDVSSGDEIVVTGKKGFITGGHVQAVNQITVKTIGALMGASTIVEVGVDPETKRKYAQLQKEVTELVKAVKNAQPVIANFAEKKAKGVRFSEEQIKYVRDVAGKLETYKTELANKNEAMRELEQLMVAQRNAKVVVKGEVYPGTTIVIGESSLVIQKKYEFCKFEIVQGDVRSVGL